MYWAAGIHVTTKAISPIVASGERDIEIDMNSEKWDNLVPGAIHITTANLQLVEGKLAIS